MMAPSFSWFASGFLKGQYDPGAVLVTSQPKQQQWKVDSVFAHSERSETNKDFPTPFSMASLRMICSHLQNPDSKVFARVYVQVPLEKTEFDSPEQRKKQAVKFEPMELLALHKLNKDPETSGFTPTLIGFHLGTQPETGLVPGGFHTLVVWQIVPGVQLGTGNMTEDQVFWSLPDDERARIRERFQSTLGSVFIA